MALSSQARRRLKILTLAVIALVGGVWWLTRPQVDPRFVGKWVDTSDPGVTMDFRGNGLAYLETRRPPPYKNALIRAAWTFDGAAVRVGQNTQPSALKGLFWIAWNRLTGQSGLSHEVVYRVDRIEADEMSLTQSALGRIGESVLVSFQLKRVTE
jgi:hypothetical protein